MMAGIGKECGFTSNFDMPEVVYPAQIGVTAQNGEQPIRLPNGLLYSRVEVEQRTHSGDEIKHIYCRQRKFFQPVIQNKHNCKSFPETIRANSRYVRAKGCFKEKLYSYNERRRVNLKVLSGGFCSFDLEV